MVATFFTNLQKQLYSTLETVTESRGKSQPVCVFTPEGGAGGGAGGGGGGGGGVEG